MAELYANPIHGGYDQRHLQTFHERIFGDIYDWAGRERDVNLSKAESVLGGLSVEYSDYRHIQSDLGEVFSRLDHTNWQSLTREQQAEELADNFAALWRVHPFPEGNTRTTSAFIAQYAQEKGIPLDRKFMATHSRYLRNALVAANGDIEGFGNLSNSQYLHDFIKQGIKEGESKMTQAGSGGSGGGQGGAGSASGGTGSGAVGSQGAASSASQAASSAAQSNQASGGQEASSNTPPSLEAGQPGATKVTPEQMVQDHQKVERSINQANQKNAEEPTGESIESRYATPVEENRQHHSHEEQKSQNEEFDQQRNQDHFDHQNSEPNQDREKKEEPQSEQIARQIQQLAVEQHRQGVKQGNLVKEARQLEGKQENILKRADLINEKKEALGDKADQDAGYQKSLKNFERDFGTTPDQAKQQSEKFAQRADEIHNEMSSMKTKEEYQQKHQALEKQYHAALEKEEPRRKNQRGQQSSSQGEQQSSQQPKKQQDRPQEAASPATQNKAEEQVAREAKKKLQSKDADKKDQQEQKKTRGQGVGV